MAVELKRVKDERKKSAEKSKKALKHSKREAEKAKSIAKKEREARKRAIKSSKEASDRYEQELRKLMEHIRLLEGELDAGGTTGGVRMRLSGNRDGGSEFSSGFSGVLSRGAAHRDELSAIMNQLEESGTTISGVGKIDI